MAFQARLLEDTIERSLWHVGGKFMNRIAIGFVILLSVPQLTACGLGSVATSTATEAAAQAQAAKDAKALEDKMRRDIEAAQQATKQQIDDAEAEATK